MSSVIPSTRSSGIRFRRPPTAWAFDLLLGSSGGRAPSLEVLECAEDPVGARIETHGRDVAPAHDAVGVDDVQRPFARAVARPVDPILPSHLTLRLEVGEQREVQVAMLGEGEVAPDAIHRDAEEALRRGSGTLEAPLGRGPSDPRRRGSSPPGRRRGSRADRETRPATASGRGSREARSQAPRCPAAAAVRGRPSSYWSPTVWAGLRPTSSARARSVIETRPARCPLSMTSPRL